MTKYVKTTWNWNQHFQEYLNKRSIWMMEFPHGSWCLFMAKGVSVKLLVWFFAAVKMQLIFKIFSTIFGVKIKSWTGWKFILPTRSMVSFLNKTMDRSGVYTSDPSLGFEDWKGREHRFHQTILFIYYFCFIWGFNKSKGKYCYSGKEQ